MGELEKVIHQLLSNPNEGAEPGQLTLRQLKEVIRVGGRAAGLVVQMEYPVQVPMFSRHLLGRIDCVWKRPRDNAIVVAWEIDGINVTRRHVFGHEVQPRPAQRNAVGIIRKLSIAKAPIKVHALYSYRTRGLLKRPNPRGIEKWHDEQVIVAAQKVRIQTDRQLLDGTLIQIVAETDAI
jgi:hypothetical protein